MNEFTAWGVPAPSIVTTAWKLRVARKALEEIKQHYSGSVLPKEVHKGWHIAVVALEQIGQDRG